MNYRHAFHAGNHADVLKHAVLLLCLEALARKPASFAVLDTHAGRGRYDLTAPEAARNPEWREGVARLLDWRDAPASLLPYLAALRRENPEGLRNYPGSPLLVQALLRPGDAHILCELHPEEAAALKDALAEKARIHIRDGFQAVGALLPPNANRGLVLLDPPYERTDELERSVAALQDGLRRFRQGVYLWWRPLKAPGLIAAADAELAGTGERFKALRADLRIRATESRGLGASSLLIVNPPFGLEQALAELLPALAARLAQDGEAGWKLKALGAL